jgi:hypothetical protein
MRPIHVVVLCLSILAAPLAAQQAEPPRDDGGSRMEEGLRLFFDGLMEEMRPALDELEGMAQTLEPAMRDFARAMGPALRDLMMQIEDWSAYHPPEILDNGDIIIRRKEDAAPPEPPQKDGQDQIEL